MNLLVDTHVFAWTMTNSARLSPAAREAIVEPGNTVFVNVASAWEMAVKVGLGKWPEAARIVADFKRNLLVTGIELLDISIEHVPTAGLMTTRHRDPFDRLLAAQANCEGLTLVTADKAATLLANQTLW